MAYGMRGATKGGKGVIQTPVSKVAAPKKSRGRKK